MPRIKRTPVPFSEGDIQHHIVTCLPARVVAQLEIRQNGKKIGVAGPGITREDLEKNIYQKFGRGDFEITALDFEGHPLEGFELVRSREPVRDLPTLAQAVSTNQPVNGADIIEAAADMVATEREVLAKQTRALDELRVAEEETRKRNNTDFVGLVKAQAAEQRTMLESVLQAMREEASAADEARSRFMAETIAAERARAAAFVEDLRTQQVLRDETWTRQIQLEKERGSMLVEGNDMKWQAALEKIQSTFTSQIETLKAQNEVQLARIREEAEKGKDLVTMGGERMPKDIAREIFMRKMDLELPLPSWPEKLKENFFEPLMEVIEPFLPAIIPRIKNLLPTDPSMPVPSEGQSPGAGSPEAPPSPSGGPVRETGNFEEPKT